MTVLHFEEVDPASPEATGCLEQYYSELHERFAEGFDVAKSLASDPSGFVRPRGVFLIVRLGARPIGCGGVTLSDPTTGYIKRMWIHSSQRGRGLGRALLSELEDVARDLGCVTAQLETNRSLSGAIAMYRASGYREVPPFNDEPYADYWFEKPLGPVREASG